MFKNAIIYRLTEPFKHTALELDALLDKHAFTPCKSQELSRYGWDRPCKELKQLTVEVGGGIMISAKKEEKLLPAQVIKEALSEKVAQIETTDTRKVYKKERDQLKDEIILDLLPRAFSKHSITRAIIIPASGWVVVESSSHKRAEELLSFLRGALGSLPITLPDVTNSPSAVMSFWLEQNQFPESFEILDQCEFKDNVLEGGVIRIKGQQLEDEEFIAHLESGKRVTKLGLEWDEQLRFVLSDDLSIKSIRMTEQLMEQQADNQAEDEIAQFDADLAMMTLEFNKLIPVLMSAFGGEVSQQAAA